MDAVQRDEAIRILLKQQGEINAKLGQLGITDQPKKALKSPDGGPVSDAHTFLKPHLTPTVHVIIKESGEEAHIRPDDFDSALHDKIKAERRARKVQDPGVAEGEETTASSGLTRDNLLTLTVPVLRTQPELSGIPVEGLPDKKVELVDLILRRRG